MDPPSPSNVGHDLGSKQLHNEKLVINGIFTAVAGNKEHGHEMLETFAPILASIMTRKINMEFIIPSHPTPPTTSIRDNSKLHIPDAISNNLTMPPFDPSCDKDLDEKVCLKSVSDGTFHPNGFEPIGSDVSVPFANTASVHSNFDSCRNLETKTSLTSAGEVVHSPTGMTAFVVDNYGSVLSEDSGRSEKGILSLKRLTDSISEFAINSHKKSRMSSNPGLGHDSPHCISQFPKLKEYCDLIEASSINKCSDIGKQILAVHNYIYTT